MSKKTVWAILKVVNNVNIEVLGLKQSIPLHVADDMRGAIFVFDTKEGAEKYSNGEGEILTLRIDDGG